jgi:hypothetical protein
MDGAGTSQESREILAKHQLATFPDRLDSVKTAGDNPQSLRQFNEFLDANTGGKPFFLQLCSTDPHPPLAIQGPVAATRSFAPSALPDAQILLANLFLHHFQGSDLAALKARLPASCRLVLVSEPARRRLHLAQGRLLAALLGFDC